MIYFDIFVSVKCCRDNKKKENRFSCKMRKIFKRYTVQNIQKVYCPKILHGKILSNNSTF